MGRPMMRSAVHQMREPKSRDLDSRAEQISRKIAEKGFAVIVMYNGITFKTMPVDRASIGYFGTPAAKNIVGLYHGLVNPQWVLDDLIWMEGNY